VKRIGLLGGAFDPIHNGHIHIAKITQKELKLDKILFLPIGRAPHKKLSASYKVRYDWIQKVLSKYKYFEVSDLDSSTLKYAYTDELIRKLPQNNSKYFFIIGSDNVSKLASWHNYSWLLDNVQMVVINRKIEEKSFEDIGYLSKLIFIKNQRMVISSSSIRKNPKKYQSFLPDEIKKEIIKKYV